MLLQLCQGTRNAAGRGRCAGSFQGLVGAGAVQAVFVLVATIDFYLGSPPEHGGGRAYSGVSSPTPMLRRIHFNVILISFHYHVNAFYCFSRFYYHFNAIVNWPGPGVPAAGLPSFWGSRGVRPRQDLREQSGLTAAGFGGSGWMCGGRWRGWWGSILKSSP